MESTEQNRTKYLQDNYLSHNASFGQVGVDVILRTLQLSSKFGQC